MAYCAGGIAEAMRGGGDNPFKRRAVRGGFGARLNDFPRLVVTILSEIQLPERDARRSQTRVTFEAANEQRLGLLGLSRRRRDRTEQIVQDRIVRHQDVRAQDGFDSTLVRRYALNDRVQITETVALLRRASGYEA